LKVRVVLDVTLRGGSDDFHPNYAARIIDSGLARLSKTNDLIVSWETIDANEVVYEGR
jgi:hypothetical protein